MSATTTSPRGTIAWPQAILFDLDGTLIDSVLDLAMEDLGADRMIAELIAVVATMTPPAQKAV